MQTNVNSTMQPDYNVNLLINLSKDHDISYCHVTYATVCIGCIVSATSLGDIRNYSKYPDAYGLYVYSSHDIQDKHMDYEIYNVYMRHLGRTLVRSKKSAQKIEA